MDREFLLSFQNYARVSEFVVSDSPENNNLHALYISYSIHREYPAKRALSAMRKQGG